jgi:hypothetical protein
MNVPIHVCEQQPAVADDRHALDRKDLRMIDG